MHVTQVSKLYKDHEQDIDTKISRAEKHARVAAASSLTSTLLNKLKAAKLDLDIKCQDPSMLLSPVTNIFEAQLAKKFNSCNSLFTTKSKQSPITEKSSIQLIRIELQQTTLLQVKELCCLLQAVHSVFNSARIATLTMVKL